MGRRTVLSEWFERVTGVRYDHCYLRCFLDDLHEFWEEGIHVDER